LKDECELSRQNENRMNKWAVRMRRLTKKNVSEGKTYAN
jgi:hypothetical protein